jgi:hypothetical protein
MSNQKKVIMLTTSKQKPILVGVDSIITVRFDETMGLSKITSREAMATITYVMKRLKKYLNK